MRYAFKDEIRIEKSLGSMGTGGGGGGGGVGVDEVAKENERRKLRDERRDEFEGRSG